MDVRASLLCTLHHLRTPARDHVIAIILARCYHKLSIISNTRVHKRWRTRDIFWFLHKSRRRSIILLHPQVHHIATTPPTSASKRSIRRFVITEKAPTRVFSWLKAATTAFTFKTLLRHYAKWTVSPRLTNLPVPYDNCIADPIRMQFECNFLKH